MPTLRRFVGLLPAGSSARVAPDPPTNVYVWNGRTTEFHRCRDCGCVSHWAAADPERDPLLPSAFRRLVFRPQGWTSAVVLVDGCVGGVWRHETKTSGTIVRVRMLAPLAAGVREALVAETERLNDFLDTKVALEFEAA